MLRMNQLYSLTLVAENSSLHPKKGIIASRDTLDARFHSHAKGFHPFGNPNLLEADITLMRVDGRVSFFRFATMQLTLK